MTKRYAPNENFPRTDKEKLKIIKSLEPLYMDIIKKLGFDPKDPNLQDSPKRMAKMMVNEIYSGCYDKEPEITVFPNTKKFNQMVVVGPIAVKSSCAHHGLPFIGEAYVGYIPGEDICGLSKLARIVNWYARRPQIQEELTEQIVDYIKDKLKPKGCGVYITSKHMCMTMRGVEETDSWMDTCALRGIFSDDGTKTEFFKFVEMKKH